MTPERIHENIADLEARQIAIEAEAAAIAEVLEGLRRLAAAIEQPGQGERVALAERPPATTPAPAETSACPDCGRSFKPQGMGPHRSRVHGDRHGGVRTRRREPALAGGRGAPPPQLKGTPPDQVAPVIRGGRETYLCSRCTEGFPTRDALLAHMRKGHPPEVARPEPMNGGRAGLETVRGAVKLA